MVCEDEGTDGHKMICMTLVLSHHHHHWWAETQSSNVRMTWIRNLLGQMCNMYFLLFGDHWKTNVGDLLAQNRSDGFLKKMSSNNYDVVWSLVWGRSPHGGWEHRSAPATLLSGGDEGEIFKHIHWGAPVTGQSHTGIGGAQVKNANKA